MCCVFVQYVLRICVCVFFARMCVCVCAGAAAAVSLGCLGLGQAGRPFRPHHAASHL